MRDWLMVLTPIAVVFYIARYPEQAEAMLNWAAGLLSSR